MGTRKRRDAAQMHVVEAVLIGLVMVAAVSFVVTFSAPTNESQPTRTRLEAQASDALAVLNEYPLPDARYGNNTLSKVVVECLQAKCTNLTNRLNGLLPDAVSYNVYINNGYAYLPVYVPKLPAGESVNVRYPLEPRLTYVWMQTATEEVAPTLRTTLGVFALPVYNSNILLDGGAGVEVRVQGYNNLNHRSFNLTAYYSTQQGVPASGFASPSVLALSGTTPTLVVDRVGDLSNTTLYLEIRETASQPLRKGMSLNLTAPRGFTLEMYQSGDYTANWNPPTTTGAATGGMSLATSLKRDLAGGSVVRLRLNATPTVAPPVGPDAYDFYSFNVRLGNGAYSVADLILKYKTGATATGGDFHALAASVPKPMGSTGSSRWAVAVQSPTLPNPAETITITRVEFLQPDGYALFSGTPTAVGAAYGGSWSVVSGGRSLVWSGAKAMAVGEAISMAVDANGAGTLTPAVPKEHQLASIRTPTSTTTFGREIGPGLFYGEIPRDERNVAGTLVGYYWPPVGGQQNIALVSDVRPVSHRATVVPGGWNYDVATTAAFRDSLSLINITLSQRIVPIGDKVVIDVDAQNLLLNLSERGIDAQTRIKLYPPWALDNHYTIRDNATQERSIFDAATSLLALHDFTKDGVKDVLAITTDGGVYVLNGKNGYKVPGLSAELSSGNIRSFAIGYLEAADVAKQHPYVLIGTEPSSTGKNLYLLDENLDQKWYSRVSIAGAPQAIVSIAVVPDVDGGTDANGNKWNDVAVGDAAGAYYYLYGNSGGTIRQDVAIGTPPATGALLAPGKWGVGKQDGIVVTTGTTVQAFQNFQLGDSTLGGVHALAKQVSIDVYDGGLLALDPQLKKIWGYGDDLSIVRVADLDGNGGTDVIGGNTDGSVVALNGTQAALPYNGMTITVGTEILDVATLRGDPYRMWSLGNDGILMYTTDAMTTRWYASDSPTKDIGGAYFSLPGARALSLANANDGWAVGDGGKIWRSANASSDTGPAVWTTQTISVTGRLDPSTSWNFKDVWALSPTTVIAVGQCGSGCSGNVAFRLTGGTWTEALGFAPATTITRLYFLDSTTGWAGTSVGAVYKTTDGGVTWSLAATAAPSSVSGLTFTSASNGWLVAGDGKLYKTTNGGSGWTSTTLQVDALFRDVDFANANDGLVVGDAGVVYRTFDGGATWVRYDGAATTDYNRASFPTSTQAYILGGPSSGTSRYVGMVATYAASSQATSRFNLAPPAGAQWITLYPRTRNMDGYTNVRFSVSPDGGTTWYEFTKKDPARSDVLNKVPETADDTADSVYHPINLGAIAINDLRLRMNLTTSSAFPYVSPEVEEVKLKVSYLDGALNKTALLTAKFTADGAVEPGSTAVWDTQATGVRSPRIDVFWNQKLSAAVLAVESGRTLTTASHNDGIMDVLVGTAGPDGRLHALSGSTGAFLWTTGSFGALTHVEAVSFVDLPYLTGDAYPDAAVVVRNTGADAACPNNPTNTARVFFVNGYNGAILPGSYPLCSPWKGFGAADLSGDGNTDVVVGQVGQLASSAGYVNAVNGKLPSQKLWRTVPSIKGLYTVEYEAPLNSMFGPYIVEVEVSGTQTIGGQSVSLITRAVNYFLVTPPDRRMPVSPIYTIELVAWYDDWDFAPGATNTEQLPPLPSNPSWPILGHPWYEAYGIG